MSATNGAAHGLKTPDVSPAVNDGDRDEGAPGVILRRWLAVVRWTLRRTDWNLITDADIDGIAQTAFTSGCELGRRQQTHGLGSRTPRYLEHDRHRW
jgi:hypothetical protein